MSKKKAKNHLLHSHRRHLDVITTSLTASSLQGVLCPFCPRGLAGWSRRVLQSLSLPVVFSRQLLLLHRISHPKLRMRGLSLSHWHLMRTPRISWTIYKTKIYVIWCIFKIALSDLMQRGVFSAKVLYLYILFAYNGEIWNLLLKIFTTMWFIEGDKIISINCLNFNGHFIF